MIYTTLDSLREIMNDVDANRWAVETDDGTVLNEAMDVPPATKANDSWSNLKRYLETLTGSGFVVIKIYTKAYKPNSGGNLKYTCRQYNFRIGNFDGTNGKDNGQNGISGIPDQYGISAQITELKVLIANMQKQAEIEELKRQLTEAKKNKKPEFFESTIKGMMKSAVTEYLQQTGYTIEGVDDDEPDEIKITKKKKVGQQTVATDNAAPAAATKLSSDVISSKTTKATVDIMANLAQFGITPSDVAVGMEEMAKMSKENPVKFKEIFTQLGAKDE